MLYFRNQWNDILAQGRKRGHSAFLPMCGRGHKSSAHRPVTEVLKMQNVPVRFSARRMVALGPNLGAPHTKAFGGGLFELRLKGAEGIALVFFCALAGKRIVMLHSFIKKSDKTPLREREIAEYRLKEIKHANS